MECLKNYIGIKGCGAITPISGLYVNSHPAITSSMVDMVANEEQVTYLNVFNDVNIYAANKFRTAVVSHLSKRYILNNIRDAFAIGKKTESGGVSNASATYRGFTIKSQTDSQLIGIYVEFLNIYLSEIPTDNFNVKIFDIDNEETLYTKEIDKDTLVVGWNKVEISKFFDATYILCCYDATQIDSIYQTLNNITNLQRPYTNSVGCACNFGYDYAYINGAKTLDLSNPYDFDNANNTYGLSGKFSVQCKFDNLVCANREHFTSAWLSLLCHAIMFFRYTTSRMNEFTTINKEDAKELMEYFHVEFEKELEAAVVGIRLDTNDGCIECNAPVTSRPARI
jgi:hypothetical protein